MFFKKIRTLIKKKKKQIKTVVLNYRKTCSMSRAPSRSGDKTLVPLWSSRMDRMARLRSDRFSPEHREATSVQMSTEDLQSSRITSSKTSKRTKTHSEVRGHLGSGVLLWFRSHIFCLLMTFKTAQKQICRV